MSDAMSRPVASSTSWVAEPSVRSSSGTDRNPMTDTKSSVCGSAFVKPPNTVESVTFGTPAQERNARSTAACNCAAVTPGTLRLVMK